MDTNELNALRARLWEAKSNNLQVGGAEVHLAALQALVGPLPGDGSVDHLIELVDQALAGKRVAHPEVKKASKAAKGETKRSELPTSVKVSKDAPKEGHQPFPPSGHLPEMPSEPPAEKAPAAEKPADDDLDFDSF